MMLSTLWCSKTLLELVWKMYLKVFEKSLNSLPPKKNNCVHPVISTILHYRSLQK